MNDLRELMENGVKVDFVQGGEEKANLVGGKIGHGWQGMKKSRHHRKCWKR